MNSKYQTSNGTIIEAYESSEVNGERYFYFRVRESGEEGNVIDSGKIQVRDAKAQVAKGEWTPL